MAWRCSSSTNSGLITNLANAGILRTPRVIEAFKAVDRGDFCLSKTTAYADAPQYIGNGVTISAPHMHSEAVENLERFLKPGAKVLDVGERTERRLAAEERTALIP